MNHSPAPATGANFSCPCSFATIEPNLMALVEKGKAEGGLTVTQALLYVHVYRSWEYYRPYLEPRRRGQIDGLIDAIGDLPVVVGAVA